MLHRISGPHNRPDSKTSNVKKYRVPKAPRGAGHKSVNYSPPDLAANNESTYGNPPPPASSTPASGIESDSTPIGPDDTNDGEMSTLEKMLTPPESDSEPHSKHQDVQVFRSQWQSHIRAGPFYPQPPNPFKEQKGAFKRRRNVINARLRRSRYTPSTNDTANGNDSSGSKNNGDDEDDDDNDNDSPHDPNAEAYILPEPTCSTPVSDVDPPTTPRRVLRSQGLDSDDDSQAVSPKTLPSQPKRKRDDSKTNITTPTQGQRISKRQRKSLGDSALPPMPPVKRTRAEQKNFESNSIISSLTRSVQVVSSVRSWRSNLGPRSGGRHRCMVSLGMETRSLSKAG